MIRQTVGSLLQEALPLALAMSVVQSHVFPSFRLLGKIIA